MLLMWLSPKERQVKAANGRGQAVEIMILLAGNKQATE